MTYAFPPYRHIVVLGEERQAARIVQESPFAFLTPAGLFMKASRRKCDDPKVAFEGPFTAEGDMENRP